MSSLNNLGYNIGRGIKKGGNYIYTGTKDYFKTEDFETFQKLFLATIVLICVVFIGFSIAYMLKIFNDNTIIVKNKDKNRKIIKNLITNP